MGHLGSNKYLAKINALAQGHNAVIPVKLEPAAPLSRLKHSTTEACVVVHVQPFIHYIYNLYLISLVIHEAK